MEETNKDLETQTDANESVEKIETVEETTKEETIETNGKNGNPSDNKNEKNGFNFEKIIVPGLIIIILAVFAGVVYYQKKVEPEKELLKEMNYGVSSMKDYFSNYISLGNYKGLTYEITQDMWDESVSDETNEYNTAKKVAEDTDQVAYNLTGYVDDKKDSNITHKDQEVIIGENSEGALKIISDALKGHKSGEEITIEGLNASDFATDGSDYSGKNVKFVAKITSVSKLSVEKVTDKWVKENYYDDYGLENADDFYKWCKQSLIEDAKAELWSKVLESSVVNKYSETAYQRVIEEVDGDYNYNADFFGMTIDEYLEMNGMTEDDMEDEYMNALKSEMVMWAIVEKEGLANKITDEDIQNKWDELYQEGDFESEEDGAVTVRDRDTMEQERVKIEDLKTYFEKKFEF